MMRASVWTAVAAAIAIGGCGDNFDSPDPDSLVTDPATVSLEIGETANVSAMFLRGGAAVADADVDLTWDSGNTKLVTVDGNGTAATLTAVLSGVTTITATSSERPYSKGTLFAKIKVTVAAAKPTAIAIAPVNPVVAAGAIVPIHVTAHLQDDTYVEVTDAVTWSVAPTTAATATGSQLKGLVAGDATLTAQYQGLYSSTDINVTP